MKMRLLHPTKKLRRRVELYRAAAAEAGEPPLLTDERRMAHWRAELGLSEVTPWG